MTDDRTRQRRVLIEMMGRETPIIDVVNEDVLLAQREPGPVMDKLLEELESDTLLRDSLIPEYEKAHDASRRADHRYDAVRNRIRNLNDRAAATRETMQTLAKRPRNNP